MSVTPRDAVVTNTASPTLNVGSAPIKRLPTAVELFGRPPTPRPWSSTRSVLDVAVELLPTIDDDLIADLVETLALAIVDREDERRALRAVLSAALTHAHTQHNEIIRLQIRLAAHRREGTAAV